MSLRILGKLIGRDQLIEVAVAARTISGIHPAQSELTNAVGGAHCLIAPAFFDVQVNGFAGVDFNSPGLSSDAIWHAIRELREKGVVLFCPTA